GSAVFTASAHGSAPLSYQWRKNGSNMPGATAPTLTLAPVSAADAADYDVVVTGACGSITSAPAHLTVFTSIVGDVARSGAADAEDVNGSVALLLTSPGGPDNAAFCAADISADGMLNAADVSAFVGILLRR